MAQFELPKSYGTNKNGEALATNRTYEFKRQRGFDPQTGEAKMIMQQMVELTLPAHTTVGDTDASFRKFSVFPNQITESDGKLVVNVRDDWTIQLKKSELNRETDQFDDLPPIEVSPLTLAMAMDDWFDYAEEAKEPVQMHLDNFIGTERPSVEPFVDKNGTTWNRVTLPAHTMIDGVDVSFRSFIVKPEQVIPTGEDMIVNFNSDRPIKLLGSIKDETVETGYRQLEPMRIKPTTIQESLNERIARQEAFKAQRQAERSAQQQVEDALRDVLDLDDDQEKENLDRLAYESRVGADGLSGQAASSQTERQR